MYSGLRCVLGVPVWIFICRVPYGARCFVFLSPLYAMESKSNRPVERFRSRGVTASVFRNASKDKDRPPFYKVSLQRTYKDGDEFKTTASLGRDDLPIAALLLQNAWEFIVEAESPDQDDK